MYKIALLSLLVFLPVGSALGNTGEGNRTHEPVDVSRSFEAQRDAIFKSLSDGETYSEISAADLQIVKDSLGRLSHLLEGVQDVNRMPEDARVRVFNEQEQVNVLLGRAHADSRMVCRREKPTGSNRPTNVCLTVAERRRHREAANDFFQHNPRAQSRPTDQ